MSIATASRAAAAVETLPYRAGNDNREQPKYGIGRLSLAGGHRVLQ